MPVKIIERRYVFYFLRFAAGGRRLSLAAGKRGLYFSLRPLLFWFFISAAPRRIFLPIEK